MRSAIYRAIYILTHANHWQHVELICLLGGFKAKASFFQSKSMAGSSFYIIETMGTYESISWDCKPLRSVIVGHKRGIQHHIEWVWRIRNNWQACIWRRYWKIRNASYNRSKSYLHCELQWPGSVSETVEVNIGDRLKGSAIVNRNLHQQPLGPHLTIFFKKSFITGLVSEEAVELSSDVFNINWSWQHITEVTNHFVSYSSPRCSC